jgi:transcriptional regulator with PAS, ATPase and Fis domain
MHDGMRTEFTMDNLLPDLFSAFPASVMICDAEGIVTYMNQAAERLLAKHGGRELLGSNLYDCHPPQAQEIIKSLLRERKTNTYTVEKAGSKRLIHQSPWYQNGKVAGLVEISFDIPPTLPNFSRG